MFEYRSRYASLETTTIDLGDGRTATYVKRRFLPQGEDMPLLVEVTVGDSDRLDHVTARTLGDPEQFWRVCDANNAMNPVDLFDETDELVRVAIPQAGS